MVATPEPGQDDAAAANGDPIYAYKPSLIGPPSVFVLKPDALHWRIGGRAGRIRYDRVRAVRMSFRPVTMQSRRFVTEIWSSDSAKVQIASASWRSVMEQERLDAAYTAFIGELHRRLAAVGTMARFSTGMPVASYWLGVTVFAAVILAMVGMLVHALQRQQWSGAAIVGVICAVFAIQLGNYFRRNRPGRYRPDAIPDAVLPHA